MKKKWNWIYEHKSSEWGESDDNRGADPEEGHDGVEVGRLLQGSDLVGTNSVDLLQIWMLKILRI